MKKNNLYNLIGLIFLLASFYTFYKLRINQDNDYNTLIIVITICILTDIGGYIFGKIFKGPKLTSISPNKTFSGAIGSYLLSLVFIIIFFQILSFFNYKTSFSYEIFLLAIIISTISQIGDILNICK